MSGFMGNLRGGVDKAAYEAKRFARIQAEQIKLGKERSQRTTHVQMLGEAAWELFEAGQLTEPKLMDICLLIRQNSNEIARLERVIEAIRHEQPPKCANCGRDLKPTDLFCANCGARAPGAAATPTPAISEAPIAAAPSAATSTPTLCPQCGSQVRSGATFCGRCGHKLIT